MGDVTALVVSDNEVKVMDFGYLRYVFKCTKGSLSKCYLVTQLYLFSSYILWTSV